jgi:hypothetical protein
MLTYAFAYQQPLAPTHAVEKIYCHDSQRKKIARFFIIRSWRADFSFAATLKIKKEMGGPKISGRPFISFQL